MALTTPYVREFYRPLVRDYISGGETPVLPFSMIEDATFFGDMSIEGSYTLGGTDDLYVQEFFDQSPNAHILTPATADDSARITLFNDVPALDFNFAGPLFSDEAFLTGEDAYIFYALNEALATGGVVFDQDDGSTSGRIGFTGYTNPDPVVFTQRLYAYYNNGVSHTGETTDLAFGSNKYGCIKISANGDLSVRIGSGSFETIISLGAPFTWADIPFALGGRYTGAISGTDIGFLAIYNRTLTTANINQVMDYIEGRFINPDFLPWNYTPPAITGTFEEDQFLTCDGGVWPGSTSLSYQWLRDGSPISGATSDVYQAVTADVGFDLDCQVTPNYSGGSGTPITALGDEVQPAAPVTERYWDPNSNQTWNSTAGTKWALTSGGTTGEAVPTTSDDVYFDANSTGNCALTVDSVWKNLDMTGYTGTMSLATSTTVSARGNVILEGSATYTGVSTTSSILDFSQAGTHYLDGDGATWACRLQVNGASSVLRLAGTATLGTMQFNMGSFYTDGFDITFTAAFSATGSGTRTLDITNSTITNSAWSVSGTNITLTATGSHIINSSTGNHTVTLGGYSYNIVTLGTNSGISSTATVSAGSMVELRIPNDTTELSGNITATTLSLLGGNLTRANLVASSTSGTQRTITSNTVTLTNRGVFRDIIGAGSGWNLSSQLSGDGGGNSGITFATGITAYRVGTGGLVNDLAQWASTSGGTGGTAARVPTLPQDIAIFDANTGTGTISGLTADETFGSLDFTGWDGSTINFLGGATIYGSFTAPVGDVALSSSSDLNFRGRDAGNTYVSAIPWPNTRAVTFSRFWTFGADYAGGSDFTISTPCDIDFAGYDITCGGNLNITMGASDSVDLTGSTITPVTTPSGTTSGGIFIGASGTLTWDGTTTFDWNQPATARVINFNSRAVPANMDITVGSGTLTINGSSNYSGNFIVAGVGNLRFQNNTTQTFSGAGTHSFTGTAGNLVNINRVSAGFANMVKTAGVVTFDYCSISNVVASGGATFTATNSTDGGGNSGITFI